MSSTTINPRKTDTIKTAPVVQTKSYTLTVINGEVVTRPTSSIRLNADGSFTIPQ